MRIILSNFSWMGFNILLAFVAVLFGWFMKRARWTLLRILYSLIWIVFLPNTLYLLTDIVHFFQNMHNVQGMGKFILVFQYLLLVLLGVITYYAAVYPAEKVAVEKLKWNQLIFILLINGLVSFGITLGRVERTNSWYLVTNLPRVLHDSMELLTSLNSVFFIVCFSLLSTLLYLTLRRGLPLVQRQRDS